jgi:hypothetical protein
MDRRHDVFVILQWTEQLILSNAENFLLTVSCHVLRGRRKASVGIFAAARGVEPGSCIADYGILRLLGSTAPRLDPVIEVRLVQPRARGGRHKAK